MTRDKATNFSRAGVNVSSALIFGSIFWRMRRTQTAIQDRMGLLQVHHLLTFAILTTQTARGSHLVQRHHKHDVTTILMALRLGALHVIQAL